MKKASYLFYAALFIVLSSCSDTTTDHTTPGADSVSTIAATASAEKPAAFAACSNLLFFKKGVEIESSTYTGGGKLIHKELSRIIDVQQEDGMQQATIESIHISDDATADRFQYNAKCNGTNFYIDIAPLMNTMDVRGTKMDVNELVFPLAIQVGQTLPDAAITINMTLGEKSIKTKYSYNHRKVEGSKEITTPAGKWNSYKIVAAIEMEMLDLDEQTKRLMESARNSMPSTHSVMWYAPEVGIVRFEVYVDGEVQGYSEITGIKQ